MAGAVLLRRILCSQIHPQKGNERIGTGEMTTHEGGCQTSSSQFADPFNRFAASDVFANTSLLASLTQ
ncbi:hypothetical protein D3C87_1550610 [compost metagenome]